MLGRSLCLIIDPHVVYYWQDKYSFQAVLLDVEIMAAFPPPHY